MITNGRVKELLKQSECVVEGDGYGDGNIELLTQLLIKAAGEYLMRPEFIGRSDLDWSMVLNEYFGVKK